MAQDQTSYRGIMKGTAIFGGVQVFNILVNILRGKFIAIFLGPAGMGVSALLTSTASTITQLTSLGLSTGAMRDISIAHQQGDLQQLSKVTKIFRRLVFTTGILGALICSIGSIWWSQIAFGTSDYTLAFVILGVMILFTTLTSGETALLQGTRRLKDLARTSLIGATTGLVIGVPMYYFWGTAGIAPAMVVLAIATYLSNRYFTRKIILPPVEVTPGDTRGYGKGMILLGVTITVSGVLGTLSVYFINWFIRFSGGIDDVGLYQASSAITTQYIGFVFSAMAVDYYPRLAAISNDNAAVSRIANQQAEIVILVATPIIIALLATTPLVVRLLLSAEFMATIPVLRWMGFALFFKAASYALGYISFAKGDKKTFFWLEGVFGNSFVAVCAVVGYSIWGFVGLGVAMLFSYAIYLVIVGAVVYFKYDFRFENQLIKLFVSLLICCGVAFLLSLCIDNQIIVTTVLGVVFLVSLLVCYRELNKRIGLKDFFYARFGKRNNNE